MAKPSIGLKNIGKDFIEIYWVPRKEAELYDVEILVREDSSMVAKSLKVSNTCAPSFLLSSLNPDSSYSLQIKFKESRSLKWSNFSDVVVYRTAAIPAAVSSPGQKVSQPPPSPDLSNPSSASTDGSHPVRPGQANCPYFMRTGKCAYGARCKYNHPPKSTYVPPPAPKPPPQNVPATNSYDSTAPKNAPLREDRASTVAPMLPQTNAAAADASKLEGDLHWLTEAILSWKKVICKHYIKQSSPWASWMISMIAKKRQKSGKLPSNVSVKDYARAVSDALGADPDLEISFDEKGMLCFLPNLESSNMKSQIEELRSANSGRQKIAKRGKELADLNRSVDSRSTQKKPGSGELVLEGAIPSVMPRTYRQASGLDEDDISESGAPYSFSQPVHPNYKQDWSSDSSFNDVDADEVDGFGNFSQSAPRNYSFPFQPQLDTLSQISHSNFQYQEHPGNEGQEMNGGGISSSSQAGGISAANPRPTNLRSYFFTSPEMAAKAGGGRGVALADRAGAAQWPEAGFLGMLVPEKQDGAGEEGAGAISDPYSFNAGVEDNDGSREVYINTHEPFCLAAVGVQGGGKSHTLACVLEACLIPFEEHDVVRLRQPMSALVLHYDHNITAVCEATGLISPMPRLARIIAGEERLDGAAEGSSIPRCVPRNMMVVLVSPSYYRQRRAFYGDYCEVRPLLFRWASLTADHIKRIMRIKEGDGQLYIASMLDLLRQYQREGMTPAFPTFVAQVRELCNLKGQEGPLAQRLRLLESVVAEGSINATLAAEGVDLYSCVRPGKLVVADMTDPLLASEEANGIFQVLTEQYRAMSSMAEDADGAAANGGCGGGKLLALDEAHKFMSGSASDGLSDAVVNVARLMRHDGMRLAVSTQSPAALAPELLELVTVAVLHRFHSRDWFDYLSKKLPLPDKARSRIMELPPGRALVFASQHAVRRAGSDRAEGAEASESVQHVLELQVRPRITADRGASRLNSSKA